MHQNFKLKGLNLFNPFFIIYFWKKMAIKSRKPANNKKQKMYKKAFGILNKTSFFKYNFGNIINNDIKII